MPNRRRLQFKLNKDGFVEKVAFSALKTVVQATSIQHYRVDCIQCYTIMRHAAAKNCSGRYAAFIWNRFLRNSAK